MKTEEFVAITEESIATLLRGCSADCDENQTEKRRRRPRWPFDSQVELWVTESDGTESWALGTALNMSLGGVAVLLDFPLEAAREMPIAIHQPEASFHGKAVVRHCTERPNGYHIGMEFVF